MKDDEREKLPRTDTPVTLDSYVLYNLSLELKMAHSGISNLEVLPSIDDVKFKSKPYLSKDKKLLKDITEIGIKVRGEDGVNNIIRRHFVELTERFLQPLNRYFDSLVQGNPHQM